MVPTASWREWSCQVRLVVTDPDALDPAAICLRALRTRSAVRANTCTTAAIVLADGALDWLLNQQVPAQLVDRSAAVTAIGGWPS
jgi:hypothetical protein